MTGLSKLDLIVIIAYLVGITGFGLYVARRVKDTEGFFMGNRRFGKALMVAQALTTGTRSAPQRCLRAPEAPGCRPRVRD